MKSWRVVLMTLMATMLVGACTPKAPEQTDDVLENQVEALDETMEIEPIVLDGFVVSTEWLAEHLEHPEVVTLHVGNERAAWSAAHIPGQAYVPFDSIVVGTMETGFELPEIGKLRSVFKAAGVGDDKVVILTGDMEGLLAARAFFSLEVLGLTKNIAILDGGLTQWIEEERPMSDKVTEPVSGLIAANANTSLVVSAAQVLAMLEDPKYQLVDARPSDQFSGETLGQSIERGGHIPGAVNIFWKDALVKKDRPLVMSVDAIKDLYAEAGVGEDAKLVTYCRTGVQSSFGYLLGRMQGRDVVMYDGSYLDWIGDANRPIEQ